MRRLVVEYLPGDLARLRQDGAAHLRVGERADVGALVDEAFATGIDHDAVEEIIALEDGAERQLVHVRRAEIPARRMAASTRCVIIADVRRSPIAFRCFSYAMVSSTTLGHHAFVFG